MERNGTHSTTRDGLMLRSESRSAATSSSDFVLQWGNRKRLRCMKVQAKDHTAGTGPVQRATARIDRRVVRSDLSNNNGSRDQLNSHNAGKSNGNGNGYLNLRQRPASPSHRILRNSESCVGMKGHSNGGLKGLISPDRECKKGGGTGTGNIIQNSSHHHHHHHNNNKNSNNNRISSSFHNDSQYHLHGGVSGSSETAHDGKKGGSLSGSDAITAMLLPKFVIALTNKEKEEDFLVLKGSKLPQRPKKRAKLIQRTLNLVCPGAWLSDLTLERYEVREKKVSKKRPRGLKAMGNMESESE